MLKKLKRKIINSFAVNHNLVAKNIYIATKINLVAKYTTFQTILSLVVESDILLVNSNRLKKILLRRP